MVRKRKKESMVCKIGACLFYSGICAFLVPAVADAYVLSMKPPAQTLSQPMAGSPMPGLSSDVLMSNTAPKSLIPEMLKDATKEQGKLLWSMYPASVRGRALNLQMPTFRGGSGWM